jgi:hypothetical protein
MVARTSGDNVGCGRMQGGKHKKGAICAPADGKNGCGRRGGDGLGGVDGPLAQPVHWTVRAIAVRS